MEQLKYTEENLYSLEMAICRICIPYIFTPNHELDMHNCFSYL